MRPVFMLCMTSSHKPCRLTIIRPRPSWESRYSRIVVGAPAFHRLTAYQTFLLVGRPSAVGPKGRLSSVWKVKKTTEDSRRTSFGLSAGSIYGTQAFGLRPLAPVPSTNENDQSNSNRTSNKSGKGNVHKVPVPPALRALQQDPTNALLGTPSLPSTPTSGQQRHPPSALVVEASGETSYEIDPSVAI